MLTVENLSYDVFDTGKKRPYSKTLISLSTMESFW